jgi:lysophospholipase L1-like esterase
MVRARFSLSALAALCAIAAALPMGARAATAPHWVGAWEAAPESGGGAVRDESFRMLVHTSIGGSSVRLRFSNSYGTAPLTLSDVTVALPDGNLPGPGIQPLTLHPVRFAHNSASLSIPAGANAYSLPVAMTVPGDAWLTVSFYVPGSYGASTFHDVGMTTSYTTTSGFGDASATTDGLDFLEPTLSYTYLSGVDVTTPSSVSTIVALGDSITDCCIEVPDSSSRWPDLLDQRLAAVPGGQRFSVVDAGISGNDVSNDRGGNATQGAAGDTRDVRDVFNEPDVHNMILFEGVNDIGSGVSAGPIEAAYLKILGAAHARGIRVFIATITPMEGNVTGGLDYTLDSPVRNQVNTWIMANAKRFDGVLNFARLVANPLNPNLWNPAYTIGDQLHPNPLGLRVIADSIPLDLFQN